MLLQAPFSPKHRGKSNKFTVINHDTDAGKAEYWLRKGEKIFSTVRTIGMPFPTPISVWCAPYNVTVYPCLDGQLTVVVYGLNQQAERVGPFRDHEHEKLVCYDHNCDMYLHVVIRVYQRSVSWKHGRDNVHKFPPFYEVNITAHRITRLDFFSSSTHYIIGDWFAAYSRGARSWKGQKMDSFDARKEQIIIYNDVGAKRRACVLSTSTQKKNHAYARECWIASIGSDSQLRRPATIDVQLEHDEIGNAKCFRAAMKHECRTYHTFYHNPRRWTLPTNDA